MEDARWLDVLECDTCNTEIPAGAGGLLLWGSETVEFSLAYCSGCGSILQRWEGPKDGVRYYMKDLDRFIEDQARRKRRS